LPGMHTTISTLVCATTRRSGSYPGLKGFSPYVQKGRGEDFGSKGRRFKSSQARHVFPRSGYRVSVQNQASALDLSFPIGARNVQFIRSYARDTGRAYGAPLTSHADGFILLPTSSGFTGS